MSLPQLPVLLDILMVQDVDRPATISDARPKQNHKRSQPGQVLFVHWTFGPMYHLFCNTFWRLETVLSVYTGAFLNWL